MVKVIKTKDRTLEVKLFNEGMIEIESPQLKNVSIEIRKVDPTDPSYGIPDSLYQIQIYQSEEKGKSLQPGLVWILSDGSIIKAGDEYRNHMEKYKK
ncbi:MAG: hypothetical protein WC812_03355 [Candidatus Pacearchaeota archaeon]|jgi:hypothetical protein